MSLFEAIAETSPQVQKSVKIRFQIRARSRTVRVRLTFSGPSGTTIERVPIGRRTSGKVHTFSWKPEAEASQTGGHRVRLAARDTQGRESTRTTIIETVPPLAAPAGYFPVAGDYHIDNGSGRFGAPRGSRLHLGQDISAPEGTPVIAPTSGSVYWRAYQASGAGYYLVIDSDTTPYYFAFLHLQAGSLLVRKGDSVQAGQTIARVGNTGRSFGAHLHFEAWNGAWYGGGKAIDPLPLLKAWQSVTVP